MSYWIALGFCVLLGIIIFLARRPAVMTYCACGCGRRIPSDSTWDGYHGPGKPIEED